MVQSTLGYLMDWVNGTGAASRVDLDTHSVWTENLQTQNNQRVGNIYVGGGHFDLLKRYIIAEPSEAVSAYRPGNWEKPAYMGKFIPSFSGSFPSLIGDMDLDGWGATGYRRAKPDHPVFNLGNAIYELKDVPEMLKQRFNFHDLKSVADFDLAVSFGWIPLLNDIIDFHQSYQKLRDRLGQFLKDEGRPVRRRIDPLFEHQDEQLLLEYSPQFPDLSPGPFVTQCYAGDNLTRVRQVQSTRIWYSGQFRYWLPVGLRDDRWYGDLARRLYGLRVTPINIYRAVPWSWLVDWFANVSDNVDNLSNAVVDSIVTDYHYVMGTTTVENKIECSGRFYQGKDQGTRLVTATSTVGRTHKVREPASPFGLRLKDDDLSVSQFNIGAAFAARQYKRR